MSEKKVVILVVTILLFLMALACDEPDDVIITDATPICVGDCE